MRRAALLLLVLAAQASAQDYLPPVTTACNDLAHPGRSPGPQFEMFFDIQRAREGELTDDKYPEVGSPMAPDIHARAWDTTLPEQPPSLSNPAKFDRKKLSLLGGYIYYYEPDGKGGRRLCRREEWANRTLVSFVTGSGTHKVIPRGKPYGDYIGEVLDEPPQPDQTHNPILAEIAKTYVPLEVMRFRYDAAGHLIESADLANHNVMNSLYGPSEKAEASEPNWQINRWVGYPNNPRSCRLYRPDGKLWRYVSSISDASPDCFAAKPDTADYFEYRYDADGKLVRSIQNLAAPNDENRWFQIWRMLIEGRQVEAEVDDVVGVMHITGAVNRIAPKDNNALNADGGVYFFPNHDAPVGILDDFSKIYDYQRVREKGGHIVRMLEAFPAGSSQLTARLWLNTANNTLLREEQYKNGKLVRAINTDFANDPVVHYYEEHLEKYKIKVKIKNLVDRVYEYDDKGNEKLVAISWTNVPKEEFYASPSPGRAGPLVDLAKDVKKAWQNRGKPKQPKPERLEFYYGLPDGTVKWKNFDEFQKAFNVHENADWLYPKGYPKRF